MKRRLIVFFMFLLVFLPLTTVNAKSPEKPNEKETGTYEVYPLPQNEQDLGTEFTLTDEVNVIIEDGIDETTKELLDNMLEDKGVDINHSDEVLSDQTNIMIGTKDSKGYVDTYFSEKVSYDASVFDEIDPYVLTLDKDLEAHGTIGVLGQDTDAAYYGLASLSMIFDQLSENHIHSMQYEDYSDTHLRGFIEGFYGFPWSHESRISLMEFGGKMKMNSYIFGPKDDEYHNNKWRELYPEDELEEIEELATVGHETKTNFIWAIHPGFNMIDWDNYDEELDTLLTKFDQMYDVGVRQFGVFLDDINLNQALENTDEHVKLITDVADWVESKEDVKPLVYTPPYYNQAWTGEEGKPYLEAFQNVPDNVEIMWTGDDVLGEVNEEDMQWVKDLIDRDPFVWLNWPVNGHAQSKLMLGKGELLKPGTHNISGVVTNPLEQAELSKVALFATADFSWNVDDFDDQQSWQDSFKYIEPDAANDFKTIASHLSDPSPSSRGLELEESEYLKDELNQFLDRFQSGESVDEVGEQLISEFDDVLDAINNFNEESNNKPMKEEIEPWLNSLEYVVTADKHAAKSVMALQDDNVNKAWKELAKASNALSESKTFTIEKIDESDVTVEAGSKRLVPFASDLLEQLDSNILQEIDPQTTSQSPITSYENEDLDNIVDGDKETYAYIQTIQENGDWYGVDLGKTIPVNNIRILQGKDDDDHDIFHEGVLEYSDDGEDWQAVGEERKGHFIEESEIEDVEARYIRYRLTHAGVPGGKDDLWTAIREFSINEHSEEIYTNVESLKDIELQTTDRSTTVEEVQDINLKPSEYIGVKLKTIEKIQDINLDINDSDLKLEVSENGVEWEKVTDDESYPNGAYVRLLNDTDQTIDFDLTKMHITLQKFTASEVSHNYQGVYEGELDTIFDGDLSSRLLLDGKQDEGKYVQVDMGGAIDVEDVTVTINDGETDYFREGDLQLSLDGESWETIHTFSHPDDVGQNFPDHEAPYRHKHVEVDGEQARYVRLLATGNYEKWLALNQISINDGQDLPKTEDLTIVAEPDGLEGYEAVQSKDKKLATFYTPSEDATSGNLIYKLSRETELDSVAILQNPDVISNANVTIRDVDGWHEIGELTESLNVLDTSNYENTLEIKLEWDDSVKPQIHEIIPVPKQKKSVDNVEDIKELVEQYEQDDAFENEKNVDQLQRHLTAVSHYEKQEDTEKVVKHMYGFKDLLDHQKENSLISEKAYDSLANASEIMIEKWDE